MWLQGNAEAVLSCPLESCLLSAELYSESEIEALLESVSEVVVEEKAYSDSQQELHLN